MESGRRRLRKPKIVSPLGRGALLLLVFGLWFLLSVLFYGQDDLELEAQPQVGLERHLLDAEVDADADADADAEVEDDEEEEEVLSDGTICVRPAIEQFPTPIFGPWLRRHGGVLLHVLLAVYTFIGLAIACDDYFVPSLDLLAERLRLPPDVAGATFMAAGSSGPELATAVIGVFVAKRSPEKNLWEALEDELVQDDIGVSGVIGSAVFNITLVIAVCALATSLGPKSTDAFYLNWWSVSRDCGWYLLSILVMLVAIANGQISYMEATFFLLLYVVYCVSMLFNERIEAAVKARITVPQSWEQAVEMQRRGKENDSSLTKTEGNVEEAQNMLETKDAANHAIEEPENPLEKPLDSDKLKLAKWAILYPLHLVLSKTIPDCRKVSHRSWFVATFLLAITWISLFSYVMVWMITVIGFTLGIPDNVMGLTFIAAGVSVPDALSGVAVVQEGHGDMAVSNAIGSNVFDILVCLGLPWFLETAVVEPGKVVKVRSKGLVYSTFSLFSTVLFLMIAAHLNQWKLDKKLGLILLGWYAFFVLFASLYEFNVFCQCSPVECPSDF